MPDAGHLASRCAQRGMSSRLSSLTRASLHKERISQVPPRVAIHIYLFLLRRFHFGLSGVELRLIGLTLAKASWGHRCS